MFNSILIACFIFSSLAVQAQFAPPAGQVGSTAIHKDSSILIAWATNCTVNRGFMDISQPHLGLANVGEAYQATGAAGDGQTLSLGDSGVATLSFEYPIRNGNGADFAIFENAFNATFLELAFVEVSSDGVNFVRFPAISNTDTSIQVGPFGAVDATKIHNFAGKYKANYGTPFDLEDLLADSAVLDLNNITHVRIVDAIGSIQDAYASRDSRGIKVNDPWNTPFGSSGLDLDAVGVIHQNTNIPIRYIPTTTINLYPNPVQAGQSIFFDLPPSIYSYSIYNLQGQLILEELSNSNQISTKNLTTGCYILSIQTDKKHFTQKIIID